MKISGNGIIETKIIDSINYVKKHNNIKAVDDETRNFTDKLFKIGYPDNQHFDLIKENDSVYGLKFELGKKLDFIHVYIGGNSELRNLQIFDSKSDTLVLPFQEIEKYLNDNLQKLESKGFALARLKLINIERMKNYLTAELFLINDKKRNLNEIVINGYAKFPEGYKKNINKRYAKQIFNKNHLKNIQEDFNKMRFVKQTKYPEILFTTDSTKVFVYVEKAKTNTFDGFVGFANDDNKKIIFNGYVDLTLNNALNIGEKLALYWKSDGKKQSTFNIGTEIPYLFKSPIGVKAQLNIFRQDSIFQNTKTNLDLGYYLNFNSKIYLGYQETESNDIANKNTTVLSDSKNSFYTASYELIDYNNNDFLFPEKTNFNFKIGSGSRNAKTQRDKQFFLALTMNHHFYLNKQNAINLKSQNYYLKSDNYLTNELFRFGGINSIRGFNENSLQASRLLSIMSEYQFVVSNSFYIHSVLDYGYFKDEATKKSDKLLGFGFGFGIITKNGLFNFIYANGSSGNQAIKFSNSVVQVSVKTSF